MSGLDQLPEGGGRESHGAGLASALVMGFFDLAGSTARCLERCPKSVEIYGWLALAGIITFIGWFPAVVWVFSQYGLPNTSLSQFVIELLIALFSLAFALILFPLHTILAALLAHLLVRYAFGGRYGLRATLVASAWAAMLIALTSAPAGFVYFLLLVILANYAVDAAATFSDLYIIAVNLCVFLWIWSKCLAGAHRLQRHHGLFAVMAAFELAFLGYVYFDV